MEIMHMISDQTALHSVQLPLFIKYKINSSVQLFQLLFIESLCIAEIWYEILVTCY